MLFGGEISAIRRNGGEVSLPASCAGNSTGVHRKFGTLLLDWISGTVIVIFVVVSVLYRILASTARQKLR
jgi:hypothetical protein